MYRKTIPVLLCLILHGCAGLPAARAQAQPLRTTVAGLFTCNAGADGLELIVTDPVDASDCTTGGGTAVPHPCWCDGTTSTWVAAGGLNPDDFVAVTGDTMTGNLTLDGAKLIVDHGGFSIMELCDDVTTTCYLTYHTGSGDLTLFGRAAQGPFVARTPNTADGFRWHNHLNALAARFDADFNLALGSQDPTDDIHVQRSDTDPVTLVLENTTVTTQTAKVELLNNSQSWQVRNNALGVWDVSLVGGNIGLSVHHQVDNNLLQVGHASAGHVDVNGSLEVDNGCVGCIGDEARLVTDTPCFGGPCTSTLTSGSWQTAAWTELEDTDAMYSGGGSASINTNGHYLVTAQMCLDGTGYPMAGRIRMNGSTVITSCTAEVSATWVSNDQTCTVCTISHTFTTIDSINVQWIADDSPGSHTVDSGHFSITRLH